MTNDDESLCCRLGNMSRMSQVIAVGFMRVGGIILCKH